MTDYSELKRLAEACHPSSGFDRMVAGVRFQSATTPETVLALIAENERLKKFEEWFGRLETCNNSLAESFRAERDQLKAENDALRKAVLEAREFIMHEAEVRGLLDENNEVSFRHPRRQAAIAVIDAAMGKGEQS